MNTVEIKIKLHEEIEHSDDRLLKMIYALVKEYNDEESDSIDEVRKYLVMEERARYIKGEGKSYSWDEVKKMAYNKQKPDEL